MPSSPSPSALPGQIGRFRVISQLGKGSQGIVYLASDTQLERNVAIKTIQLEKPSAMVKQQLLKESRTVSKLQHPNIITLFEADEDNGKPYLVFEYVDGITLREYLIKKGRIPAKNAINFLDPILNAIAYAHKLGVIHRDLSPHNIMLTSGNDVPRLMDFGIATLMGNPTEDGVWGTLNYLSPEQCNNKKVIAASDIFTLGLILFEMIVGKPAIEGDNKFAIINKILNEEIKYPKDIDPGLKPIIQKALEKDSATRYGDALDMRQDLLALLEKIDPENSKEKSKSSDSTNTTIQFLLRRMEQKKDFPTMSHQVVEVSQKAQADSDSSANILSNAILKDYSLSSKLLRLVNSPMYSGYGGRISTVSRAVVILGFEEVRNAALGLMLLDHLKDENQADSLKEACIESMISGSIANDLAKKLKIRDTEEAYVCSMFHRLGKMLAIYYFPEEMEVILEHVKRKGMKEEHAAQSVLGVTFEEIGIAVGETWELPSEIIESMHSLPPGELKKPISQTDTLKH
jgi:eukaryotic-like serine/threonine-protein kinase